MCSHFNTPGIEQLGSFEKVKFIVVEQVTSLLPSLIALELEHLTSTTVPIATGNCAVVSIVLVHSGFSPVQVAEVLCNSKDTFCTGDYLLLLLRYQSYMLHNFICQIAFVRLKSDGQEPRILH